MKQLTCETCADPLSADDSFCGTCGTPIGSGPADTDATGVAGATAQPQMPPGPAEDDRAAQPPPASAAPASAAPPQPFFRHLPAPPRPTWMTNDTRYLCAAAYKNFWYAYTVVRFLLGSPRSVVPSVGMDLGPIIRHCLRARKMVLARDSILLVLMLIGLVKEPVPTLDFLIIAFLLGYFLPATHWRRHGWLGKIAIAVCVLTAVSAIAGLTLALLAAEFVTTLALSGSVTAGLTRVITLVGAFAFLFAATWATEFGYRHAVLTTLARDLQPGAAPPAPGHSGAERRIAEIEAAQHGNVTLYGKENPFIGTGYEVDRHWSIAVELNRAQRAESGAGRRRTSREYAPIDPVELHAYIRQRLLRLNDPRLPQNERVATLSVRDHVVGSGVLPLRSPVVDQATMTPYEQASPEAIEALIRHPQAGLRYYQRASVIDWGPPVTSSDQLVISDLDLGVAVSAFVYAAVEGRMFYLQFARTALTPVNSWYRSIDNHAGAAGKSRAAAVEAVREMFRSVVRSPAGIFAAFAMTRHERRADPRTRHIHDGSHADFGALLSVRELGAADDYGTRLQELDVEKYTFVFERLLLDTVMDFLDARGVDISDFRASAGNIINNVFGNAQIGSNNTMTNTRSAQSGQ
jgi:hypothetical protein